MPVVLVMALCTAIYREVAHETVNFTGVGAYTTSTQPKGDVHYTMGKTSASPTHHQHMLQPPYQSGDGSLVGRDDQERGCDCQGGVCPPGRHCMEERCAECRATRALRWQPAKPR